MLTIMKLLATLFVLHFVLDNVCCLDVYRMSVELEAEFRQQTEYEAPQAVKFAFAKHFQDHMVLQQAPAGANIYGFAPESSIGQRVTLQLVTPTSSDNYWAAVKPGRAPGVGEWMISLDPVKRGTTVSINATLQEQSLTLNDVIYGDVWLCSGQSNMQFTVIQMFGAEEEIADAHNYPDIRLMTVAMRDASTPQYDLISVEQGWTKADNASVGGPAWRYFSAVCWLFGKNIHKSLGYPIGLIATDWGGTPVEAWSSKEALASCNVTESTPVQHPESYRNYVDQLSPDDRRLLIGPDDNSVLWNAMIYPLLNMTIYGAIWYQGEADASGEKMNRYNCTFPTMIRDWRKNFNQASGGRTSNTFPFGFVQLAPNANKSVDTGFPDIRWHQTADHGYVPNPDMFNVFMAVAMDLPDFNSSFGTVHPRDKKDVGERLALSGLAVAYGQSTIKFMGPFPSTAALWPDGIKLTYSDYWILDVRTTNGFEFQCTVGDSSFWAPTTIVAHDNTSVTLDLYGCPMNETITGIRYEWRESPCEFKKCAVYEIINDLPAPPFTFPLKAQQHIDGKNVFKFKHPAFA